MLASESTAAIKAENITALKSNSDLKAEVERHKVIADQLKSEAEGLLRRFMELERQLAEQSAHLHDLRTRRDPEKEAMRVELNEVLVMSAVLSTSLRVCQGWKKLGFCVMQSPLDARKVSI